MKKYRVDQIIEDKIYEGGVSFLHKGLAKKYANERLEADRMTGEERTTYKITTICSIGGRTRRQS